MKLFRPVFLLLPLVIFCNACSVQAATTSTNYAAKIQRVDYTGFTLWLDCNQHGAVKFQYNAQRDVGNLSRVEKFSLDSNVPKECQQTSAKTYGFNYDRGHLVPANHLDYSQKAITDSNFMTNILPQAATMNRGAWLLTEEIIECYRDIDELLVIGGVIWGNNTKDDYFVKSHGIKTPDAFWKVVIRGTLNNEQVIAWIVPNSAAAQRSKLDSYLVSVAKIESITGEKIPVNAELKNDVLKKSWIVPKGCNKG
ncbi:MAG: DNA/RNA non-specific endonuclease [Methylococcaceae bacterium]